MREGPLEVGDKLIDDGVDWSIPKPRKEQFHFGGDLGDRIHVGDRLSHPGEFTFSTESANRFPIGGDQFSRPQDGFLDSIGFDEVSIGDHELDRGAILDSIHGGVNIPAENGQHRISTGWFTAGKNDGSAVDARWHESVELDRLGHDVKVVHNTRKTSFREMT